MAKIIISKFPWYILQRDNRSKNGCL